MRIGIMVTAAGAALLSGCVSPIVRNGAAMPGAAALRTASFIMAEAPPGNDPGLVEARQAVRSELASRGLRESREASYRVDVGFAVAPRPVEVTVGPDAATAPMPAGIGLCRRRQYVLSIAMIDRSDGRVVFRNSATARRCAKAAAKAVPQLARTAVGR